LLPPWLLYGANGYTGALIAREAARRGMSPILAGRNAGAIAALAHELGLIHRVFPVAAASLGGIALVLHCAGPFSTTAAPMMDACLRAGVHYLDITGEIAVFEQAWARNAQARSAGVVLCPGVGFDVIPTDCIAAALKHILPDARRLALGFDSQSALSRGTARTAVEALAMPGRVRRDGRIIDVPQAWRVRRIDFGGGEKTAMTIAWGDVSTAFHSTGIPDIEVYAAVTDEIVRAARLSNQLRWLVRLAPVQGLLKRAADRMAGPAVATRARQVTHVWGEAENAAGTRRVARIRTANGYDVTVQGALAVVAFVLQRNGPGGTLTPSMLMGRKFVEQLPGSGTIRIIDH
jgi:short subunit dehydrogenase-like uncharacterized protein